MNGFHHNLSVMPRCLVIACLGYLLFGSPVVAGISAEDPTYDEDTQVGLFVPADICHDGAIDVTWTSAENTSTDLFLNLTVRDLTGNWRCADAGQTASSTELLEVRLRPQYYGPSVTAWMTTTEGFSTYPEERCYSVYFGHTITECGVGSVDNDTITWRIPLVTDEYILVGSSYKGVDGRGAVSFGFPFSEFTVFTQDLNELGSWSI